LKRKVLISKTAEKKLDKLFDYFLNEWSKKVKDEFIEKLSNSIEIIQTQPEIFPESKKGKNLRRCTITKQTTLYYRFNSKHIYIVTLFDTRQDPGRLKSNLL